MFYRSLLTRVRSSEKGSMIPLLGLSIMALSGFTGVAVDIARVQLVQSRLSYALDAAGLAAGSTINTTNLDTEVAKYMNANFPAGYLGATAAQTSATASTDNMVITLSASTTVPMTFMKILGESSKTITVTSEVTRTASGLELVMALDNTGSMAGTKLSSLKSAATSLVNILYGSKTTVPNLWIGLVPFSQAVNVGTTHTDWMDTTYNATLNWGPTSWMGCVDARETSGYDVTDDPPSIMKFKAYYSPSTDNRPAPYNTTTYTTANKWVKTRDSSGNPLTYYTGLGTTLGPNKNCPQIVTPMTSNKTTILNAINAMAATGNTHIPLGLGWAWRMISPKWRGLGWSSEMTSSALPLDYGTAHMNKAIILLTDGENTMSQQIFTAYGYLSDGRLGSTTNASVAKSTLDTKLTSACTAIKAKGVYVYTIALGNPGTTVQNLLKACATSENYYFNSPSTSELNSIFSAIADSLSNLRVSK